MMHSAEFNSPIGLGWAGWAVAAHCLAPAAAAAELRGGQPSGTPDLTGHESRKGDQISHREARGAQDICSSFSINKRRHLDR